MAYKMEWIDEPWLLRVDYIGTITETDAEEVLQKCLEYADKHTINFLVNLSESNGFSPAVVKTKTGLKLLRHRNVKWWGYVGIKGIFQMGTKIFMRLVPFKAFNTVEEAQKFLEEMVVHQKQEAAPVEKGA
jgi:hypothetical protein